jgi:tol-pal system protein YbgF
MRRLFERSSNVKRTAVLRLRRLAIIAAIAALAGCATQADIQEIQSEQRRMRTQLADTRASLDQLQRSISTVRGGLEEVQHTAKGRQADDRVTALEGRIAAVEQSRVAAPGANGETPADMTPAGSPARRPLSDKPEVAAADLAREEARDVPDEYRRGLSLMRDGAYDRAIQRFREFMRANPDSPLAPNALYWVGESYYMLGDYYQAILQYNEVRQRHPKSDRAPAAVLKIGSAFLQMGNKSEARLAFQKVVNDYPTSPEALEAKERLAALGA